ncbi:MAG: hypothetical protein Q9190_005883 [Brigantiaea leucoxantha]
MEKHLNERFFENGAWLHGGFTMIQKWLGDSEATQTLNRKKLGWLRTAHTSDIFFPMREVAIMIARQWLCKRSFDPRLPYHWINVFVLRQEEIQSQNKNATKDGSDKNEVGFINSSPREYTSADFYNEEETASTRIERSAKWAVASAGLDENSLYFERLGRTYWSYGKNDVAIETLLKAKKLPDPSWQLSQYLADAYAQKDETRLALEEMETVFAFRRADDELSPSGKAELIDDLKKAAGWYMKLSNAPDAVAKLEQAIRLDEHCYKSYYELFNLLNDTKQGPKAMRVLIDLDKAPAAQHEDLTKLGSMLLEYPRWIGEIESLENVLQAAKSHEVFDTILSALQKALDFAVNKNMDAYIVDLYLGHGLALASADKVNEYEINEYAHSALEQWEKCFQIGIKSEEWESQIKAIGAAKFIFNHYFSRAHAALELSNADTDDYTLSVKKMKDIAEAKCHNEFGLPPLRASLASFYASEGSQEKARELLVDDLRKAIDHLSIPVSDSTFEGYNTIAICLMHARDDLDAMSAWFLCGIGFVDSFYPKKCGQNQNEHEEGEERVTNSVVPAPEVSQALVKLPFYCDGRCNKTFTYADSLWFCKVCFEINFCDECLGKLQNGTLPRHICSADHQWLLVPSWLDELKATGKGRVRIGGVLKDGKREGGDIVTADEWLDTVKERWKLTLAKEDEQKQDDKETNAR